MEHTESETATVSGDGHESLRDSPPPPDYYEVTERNPHQYLPPQDFPDTQTPNSPQTTLFPLHHQHHPPQPQYQPPQEATQFSTTSETGANRSSRPAIDRLPRAIENNAKLYRYTYALAVITLIPCYLFLLCLFPCQCAAFKFSNIVKNATSPAKKIGSAICSITCSITSFISGCLIIIVSPIIIGIVAHSFNS